jgi:hypothetical protein
MILVSFGSGGGPKNDGIWATAASAATSKNTQRCRAAFIRQFLDKEIACLSPGRPGVPRVPAPGRVKVLFKPPSENKAELCWI